MIIIVIMMVMMMLKMLYRWAHEHTMDKQPDYLKFVLNFMIDTFEEFERELWPQGRSYNVSASKEVVKQSNYLLYWYD